MSPKLNPRGETPESYPSLVKLLITALLPGIVVLTLWEDLGRLPWWEFWCNLCFKGFLMCVTKR